MGKEEENTEKSESIDREYVDIIKADLTVDKEFIDGTGAPAKIVYYCQDCESVTTPKRIGKKLAFSCSECKGSKVSFGREESIKNHYRIKSLKKVETKPE